MATVPMTLTPEAVEYAFDVPMGSYYPSRILEWSHKLWARYAALPEAHDVAKRLWHSNEAHGEHAPGGSHWAVLADIDEQFLQVLPSRIAAIEEKVEEKRRIGRRMTKAGYMKGVTAPSMEEYMEARHTGDDQKHLDALRQEYAFWRRVKAAFFQLYYHGGFIDDSAANLSNECRFRILQRRFRSRAELLEACPALLVEYDVMTSEDYRLRPGFGGGLTLEEWAEKVLSSEHNCRAPTLWHGQCGHKLLLETAVDPSELEKIVRAFTVKRVVDPHNRKSARPY